jgi:hypothetical protein
MSLVVIATNACENGPCPTFHKTEGGVVIQAYRITNSKLLPQGIPDHEVASFIPDVDFDQLLFELLRYYRENSIPLPTGSRRG